jgi:hypothetical protein
MMKNINSQNSRFRLIDFVNLPSGKLEYPNVFCYKIIKNQLTSDLKLIQNVDYFTGVLTAVSLANETAKDDEVFLEFGFCSGRTINFIGALAPKHLIYGFNTGNGIGIGDILNRKFAYTKKIDSVEDGEFKRWDMPGKEEYTYKGNVKITLCNRTSEADEPFIPFTPLCNVNLILGNIIDQLQKFIQVKLITENKKCKFIFINNRLDFDVNIILSYLLSYLSDECIIVLSGKQIEEIPLIQNIQNTSNKELKIFTQDNVGLKLSHFILMPPSTLSRENTPQTLSTPDAGFNVLHFNSTNRIKDFSSNSTLDDLKKQFNEHQAKRTSSDSEILRFSINKAREKWNTNISDSEMIFLEFGFCSGRSINFIANLIGRNEQVFGFDSCIGLPERWRHKFPQGTFRYLKTIDTETDDSKIIFQHSNSLSYTDNTFIPFIPHKQVTLIPGRIQDTLLPFIETYLSTDSTIGMIYIDTDLKSAADCILNSLTKYIVADHICPK